MIAADVKRQDPLDLHGPLEYHRQAFDRYAHLMPGNEGEAAEPLEVRGASKGAWASR
jgi:hypothetical protein